MNVRAILTTILALAAIAFIADSAMAEKIDIQGHKPDQVQGKCDKDGDVYFAPNKYGVYGCTYADGSGIVCGGKGKDAKTCDTFKRLPPRLPTRSEVRQAEKA